MTGARQRLAVASCGLLMTAVGLAVFFGPASTRIWMLICGVAAAAFAVESVVSDPSDLTLALALCTAPLLALLGEGSPEWLIAPLAVLLLLGGELNALSWASQGQPTLDAVGRKRLMNSLQLAGMALPASLAIMALGQLWTSGRGVAFVVGVAGLAGLGAVFFRRR